MSQLTQLKAQTNGLANSARKAATGLGSFQQNFASQILAVTATIGGSAQGKDRKMIADLQQANRAVQQAVAALQQAAQTATTYAASL